MLEQLGATWHIIYCLMVAYCFHMQWRKLSHWQHWRQVQLSVQSAFIHAIKCLGWPCLHLLVSVCAHFMPLGMDGMWDSDKGDPDKNLFSSDKLWEDKEVQKIPTVNSKSLSTQRFVPLSLHLWQWHCIPVATRCRAETNVKVGEGSCFLGFIFTPPQGSNVFLFCFVLVSSSVQSALVAPCTILLHADQITLWVNCYLMMNP